MPESVVVATLATAERRFASRHIDLNAVLAENFAVVARHVKGAEPLSAERRRLIGAYFTQEYSIEAAALTNPSIVEAPDQSNLAAGERRFLLSLRAIGEGHISSIEFRSGVIDADGGVVMDPLSPYVSTARHRPPVYEKSMFRTKLTELNSFDETAASVLDALPERFTIDDLEASIRDVERKHGSSGAAQATRTMHWLASSNYESSFGADSKISERIVFPAGPTESHGMEDARFVRFTHDDGRVTYFASYTAFDGYRILPQLIETPDFVSFRIATLNGASAKNKGMALFPRMINGRYVALSRLDNETNLIMSSDNIHFWHDSERIQSPKCPWELTQIGNSGSPLETEAGWLVMTHGVGPFREYSLGAVLLDKADPTKVIGHLDEPLVVPDEDERDGYVPNVVYSCGSMISGEMLVVPYGFSDVGMRIATVRLDDLLARLTERPPASQRATSGGPISPALTVTPIETRQF
ncbi:MAG TPA: glycoside hydrolase family 130 protein [Polyangiaceae bacterium]|nr:glycoside hydrolase family 130 protein [Polyangiaceae bacterium]